MPSAVSTSLRRSPRLLELNNPSQQPEEVQPNPKPRSGYNDQVSSRSTTLRSFSASNSSQEKHPNNYPERYLKKVEVINGSSMNCPRSSSKVDGILGLRRSPRFLNRENYDVRTCGDESNRSIDCRTRRSISGLDGIQYIGRCSWFCNQERSHGTYNHQNEGSIDSDSHGHKGSSPDTGRTKRRGRRSSVAPPLTPMETGEKKSRLFNEEGIKEYDDSEMKVIQSIAATPPARSIMSARREKYSADVKQAGGHPSNLLKGRRKLKVQADIASLEAPREVLREREMDHGKQVRVDSSKQHLAGRVSTMMKKQTSAARSERGKVKMEWGDGKENKGGNASSLSDVHPGQCGRKDDFREDCEGTRVISFRRKRKQVEAAEDIELGWTKEQEMALQRAYFAAKPTPQFWKKVAKLVPGKSAQDCFDKVHSNDSTPPLSQRPSRATARNISPLSRPSFSACKLLVDPEAGNQKACTNKQKTHIVRRHARHILRKHCQVDKDDQPDFFSLLEPTVDKSAPVTPDRFVGGLGSSPMSSKRSSSSRKKCLSRLSTLSGAAVTSPPVLKQVKNVALHDKYIDRLHIREAKRKAVSKRNGKSISVEESKNGIPAQNKDVIRAARNALISSASDAINKLKDLQRIDVMDEFSDREGCFDNEEFEGEEVDAL